MNTIDKIELMAPAGSFESLQAAIDNGADSVYFGIEQLNMRARSSINFTLEDLKEIARRCNEKNVRTYITLNTIIYDHDLTMIKKIIDAAKEAKITAVIASDQGVIGYARSQNVEVHLSTQLNITNIETLKFYSLFADVAVLSRELSLRQIKSICDAVKREEIRGPSGNLMEIEIFGHGALCMAVSGKCYLSLHSNNSSANRGACVQNCRRKYTVIDEEGVELEIDNEYIMSPKDLCTLDFLPQVIDTGIDVLKIEGRARAPEYVATVIRVYREAIDAVYDGTYTKERSDAWMKELETVYNRGFWGGYYLGQKLGEWNDQAGSKATQKKVYLGKGVHYYKKPKVGHFKIEAHQLKAGDKILITGPTTGVIEMEVDELWVDEKIVPEAGRGADVTFGIDKVIRASDKLYKIVPTE
ncbi:MAG: U32 family peptidase [Bacteroidetes bacterium]|nr:MAG: U32 family peptidase [Bacteroidota bacterium]